MDIRRLEVFCKVFELKSFTKAADALSLSQPTVSEHIRLLEKSVGELLIDRLGREVVPTPAGHVFYKYAVHIIQTLQESLQALSQFKGLLEGRLVLGASTIPGTYILPKYIGSFTSSHPAIRITLKIGDTVNIVEQILDGELEAGIVGYSWNENRLLTEKIFSDELVLAVHPSHRWAKKKKIALTELVGEPFILREKGSGTRMVLRNIMEEHGLDLERLSVVAEMGSTESVRQGLRAGIGISILSEQAVNEDFAIGNLVRVEIQDVRFLRPMHLALRKNRQITPLCKAFLAHLQGNVNS